MQTDVRFVLCASIFLLLRGKQNYYLVRGYSLNLLKPTGHVMHQQFNIQQLYVLPTLY